ncbi:MAG: transcription termination/antitermination protein NusG [Clostridia bacterium]|nr:transcription termination/antitermination protein NusG [Clostridia bacterium]
MSEHKWYVLHTYAGHEDVVKANLTQMAIINELTDVITDIQIPTEQSVEVHNGKRKVVETKIYPCYVYIKMVYSPQLWYMLTNTRGVTGFVGPQGKAWPLTDEEVKRLRLEQSTVEFNLNIGDRVRVIAGPFETMAGTIRSIDTNHEKVSVFLTLFGRETNVELGFSEVEGLDRHEENDKPD